MTLSLFLYFAFLQLTSAFHIESLTDATYRQHFRSHPFTVVKVYAPWCVRSIHLAAQFNTAVHEVSSRLSDLADPLTVSFAEIDGTTSPSLQSDWTLQGFPAIVMVTNKGRTRDVYNGDRTDRSIANWIIRTLPPTMKLLNSEAAVDSWSRIFSPLYVAHLVPSDKSILTTMESVARKNVGVFASVMNENVASSEVHVYRQDEGHAATLEGSDLTNKRAIEEFINRESIPLITRLSSDTYKFYLDETNGYNKESTVWFVGSPDEYHSILPELQNIAREFRDHPVLFAWVSTDSHNDHVWSSLSVSDTPTLIFQSSNHQVFQFPESILSANTQTIQQFIQQGLDNQLSHVKHRSQSTTLPSNTRIAEDEDGKQSQSKASHVISIVADNFESNVFNDDKDSLVAVLAPWGVTSPKLEDALDQYSAKTDELQQQVKLFKIDGTNNDVQQFQGFEITKFPSVFYVQAKSRLPIRFSGPASVDAISMFIERASNGELLTPIVVQE